MEGEPTLELTCTCMRVIRGNEALEAVILWAAGCVLWCDHCKGAIDLGLLHPDGWDKEV